MASNSTTNSTTPVVVLPYKIWMPGERPDYNRGPEIIATCGVLTAMAVFVVALRVWVRMVFIRKVAWDDYWMIAAVTVLFGMYMVIIPEVRKGGGRHIEYIPPADIVPGLHLNFATQPTCLVALGLAKLSVGSFLLRVSPSKGFTWFIYGLQIVTVLSTVAAVLNVLLQCRPMEFAWNKSLPNGECLPLSDLIFSSYFNGAFSILTDFIFAVLPIPMLWNVQLNWRVKSAIAAILSLGLFTTAAAIVKMTYISNWGKEGDFLMDVTDITIWYTAEISVAIIAGSIPCLKPLFKKILESTSALRYGSSKYGNKYGSQKLGPGGYAKGSQSGNNTGGSKNETMVSGTGNSRVRRNKYGGDDADLGDEEAGDVDGFEMYTRNNHGPGSVGVAISSSGKKMSGHGGVGVKTTVRDKAGSSEESIIIQRPQDGAVPPPGKKGITRTMQISVQVDEARAKSVRDMV